MKLLVEDKWMGDGTAYSWRAEEDGRIFEGIAGSLCMALRDAGNAIQRSRSYEGLEALAIVKVEVP